MFSKFNKIKSNIETSKGFADDFYNKSVNFDTESVANKFIEIFQIMIKKLVNSQNLLKNTCNLKIYIYIFGVLAMEIVFMAIHKFC